MGVLIWWDCLFTSFCLTELTKGVMINTNKGQGGNMEISLFIEKAQRFLGKGIEAFNGNTHNLTQVDMIVLAAIGAVGLLFCFFGLKLVRIWAALFGFAGGAALGLYAASYFNVSSSVSWVIGLVAGLILAGLSTWLYRFGIFLVGWGMGSAIAFYLINPTGWPLIAVCAGIGFVIALIALKLCVPVIMVITGLFGGLAAGQVIYQFIPGDFKILQIVLPVVIVILGILVQFLLESKKRKKLHLKKAEEIRMKNSTANEVDKARSALDNLDGSTPADEEEQEKQKS